MRRNVQSVLDIQIENPTTLVLQIALAQQTGADIKESLTITHNGEQIFPVEIIGHHGNRIHKLEVPEGQVKAEYTAEIIGQSDFSPVTSIDELLYLRPSRYAEADKFFGYAGHEFEKIKDHKQLLTYVSSFVGDRLDYVPGASTPTDGATDTLLAGSGVCRDYAHLVVALLRAVGIPARLVAVYAPGCDPMDFHAVAEALVDGQWRVVDATCLAPRQTMLRISTGRDAGDTAFLENHGGQINLNDYTVTATVEGDIPEDDLDNLVTLQ